MLEKILKRLESENVENPVWIVGPETGQFLHDLVLKRRPGVVLEIGTSIGYSALWLASALAEGGELWTIESHAQRFARAETNIAESGFGGRIHQVKGHAPEILSEMKFSRGIDLAFFDATKKETQMFFDAVSPFMNAGGLIVVDNVVSHKDVPEMAEFIESVREKSEEVEIGAGLLLIGEKGLHTT